VDIVSAWSLGPANRSSVLAGYRAEVTAWSGGTAVIAMHTVVGDERSDEHLAWLLNTALDGVFGDLRRGVRPAMALGRAHSWAGREGCHLSAVACQLDGRAMTVARAGLAQVNTASPEPGLLLAPEVLPIDIRPPILASALGAVTAAQPPSDIVTPSRHVLLIVGGDVGPNDLAHLHGLRPVGMQPTTRGGIAVELRGSPGVPNGPSRTSNVSNGPFRTWPPDR